MDGVSTVVRGEEELFARTAHLFESAAEVACAAADLSTFAASHRSRQPTGDYRAKRVRKIYRPAVLLDRAAAGHLGELVRLGAEVRISADEINETIILDRRVVILAGDRTAGPRGYSVLTGEETVQGVVSLFEAAWRGATELAVYDASVAEIRTLAPRILDMLASGCKDETAARSLGLGLRTYRRRVAELMTALGATSRFQAGVRAGELGLL
ncbi:DNA-binding response regulator [Amycolatopsis magusensis]|uniref:DNA-binding response regulator n=1 Tax=Amycolatopsis magusensis TaxID=882444 RepID=UPI001AEB122E|nr:DNA-binding response regulator [Amycolatopsis magusensis]